MSPIFINTLYPSDIKLHVPKDDAEGEYFEQHWSSYRQVFLFAGHCQRSLRESSVIEGELKGDMHGVEKDLLAHELDL